MTNETLQEAIAEAERFLAKAKAVKQADFEYSFPANGASVRTGAVRRASMDLTRALARMRKP